MYPKTKSGALTIEQATDRVGADVISRLMSINCGFTGRVIDDCYGVEEMSASIDAIDADGENCRVTIYYYVNKDEIGDCDGDLSLLSYDDYYFIID